MSLSPRIAWDATVVRPPLSGVHLSVQAELLAMFGLPGTAGGTLFSLCPQLRQRASETDIAAPSLAPGLRRVAQRILWQQTRLPAQLRACADVLHATAYTCPLRSPVPVVLNVHDIIALERPELCSRPNVWHMRLLLARSIRRAVMNVTTTAHVADRVRTLLGIPAERLAVVPLGVDATRFSTPAGQPPSDPRPYLLFVGNIEPKKGLEALLDAYARIAPALGLDLVLAGRPGWRCEKLLERLRRWCGPGRVVLAGRVSDEELVRLYQGAWAFVFPSLCEGFGLPVLEAMAAGAPVIHSNHPAVREVVGSAGVVFPVGDGEALAKALRHLNASPNLRNELVAAGRLRAAQFTWERRARTVLDILLAAGERPPA
jgi:glycosyltransferase involved in cell wall biosynthesis